MAARITFGRAFGMLGVAAWLAITGSVVRAGTIRGTVLDRDGKPAAGAKVRAGKLGFMEPLTVREATADSEGKFAVTVEPGDWGVFAVRGDEGGRLGWRSMPHVEEKKDPDPVTVKLGAPSKLRGRLFDAETGKPITSGHLALDDARLVPLDSEGRFEAPGLDVSEHEAYPLCPGYERRRILFDTTGRPDCELELRIPKAGKIIGQVLDQDGKPIPGAAVGLRTSGSFFSGSALWEACSEDGRFSYDGRPLGRGGRFSARAPGYADEERQDVVVTDADHPARIDFTLRPDPTLAKGAKAVPLPQTRRNVSGTVTGPDGKPLAGVVVRWDLRTSSEAVPETKTDEKGSFRLTGVPDAKNVLSVFAPKLAPEFPMIEAGGDREVKVQLKRGATIRGRVVDDAGKPIEGVRIAPSVNNPKPNWGGFVYLDELYATTDGDGRFTLEGVPAGVKIDLVAEGWSALRQKPLDPSDEAKNTFTLLGDGAIRGRVVDPTGKPVRNFRVQVNIPKGAKPGDPVGGYFAGYSGTGLSFTRDDGEFTISQLTAGNLHRLTVIADGYGIGEAESVEAKQARRLTPGDTLEIKLGLPHAVRVRVIGPLGKPVEGARVTLVQTEGRGGFQWGVGGWEDSVTAPADAKGYSEFRAIPFREGIVVVQGRGFSRRKVDWANDEEELTVDLEPEARIMGTVLDEAGKPAVGARMLVSWGQGEMMNVPIDEKDGSYRADGLPSGKFALNVLPAAGPALFSGPVTLQIGQTLTKDIRVKLPGR